MIEFRNQECLAGMAGIESESVDMVFADPPFAVGVKYDVYKDNLRGEEYYDWCELWINECLRILKPTGSIYLMTLSRHTPAMHAILSRQAVFVNEIMWRNVSANHSKRGFWNSYQPILLYGKTKDYLFNTYAQTRKIAPENMRWGGYSTEPKGQLLDYWDDIPFVYAGSIRHLEAVMEGNTNSKLHPAQMPIALAERCIVFSTNEGGLVVDPFCGVGAAGLACYRTKRSYVGFDLSQRYIEVCHKRLAELVAQPSLI